jgi:hypothetical protein
MTSPSSETLEKISLSVDEWVVLQQSPDGKGKIPVWFQVTGCSMLPFIRPFRDNVMIVAVGENELKVGDIVLFPGKYAGGDYCLHRLHRIEGDRVQTFGDGNKRPDGWQPKERILGKAVLIKRGRFVIDCESPRWVKWFRLWNALLPLRPMLLLPFRVMNKLHSLKKKYLA